MWLDPLVERRHLKSINVTTNLFNIRMELLKEKLAADNKQVWFFFFFFFFFFLNLYYFKEVQSVLRGLGVGGGGRVDGLNFFLSTLIFPVCLFDAIVQRLSPFSYFPAISVIPLFFLPSSCPHFNPIPTLLPPLPFPPCPPLPPRPPPVIRNKQSLP